MFYQFMNFKKRIPFPFIDIYLFRWNELRSTGIHNHAKKGCYILLLNGGIKEKVYNHSIEYQKTNIYKAPSLSYMCDTIGLHSIEPLKRSTSIHFYYPKGHKTKYFTNS
tara:strand:+ start:4093 stop:4419 length:327 start_codon:yes stop_codon:yes gene_type:complete